MGGYEEQKPEKPNLDYEPLCLDCIHTPCLCILTKLELKLKLLKNMGPPNLEEQRSNKEQKEAPEKEEEENPEASGGVQKETPREVNTPPTVKEGLMVPEAAKQQSGGANKRKRNNSPNKEPELRPRLEPQNKKRQSVKDLIEQHNKKQNSGAITNRQEDRQRARLADRQTDRQADRQTDS